MLLLKMPHLWFQMAANNYESDVEMASIFLLVTRAINLKQASSVRCVFLDLQCSEDSQCCGGTCYRHDITMELGTCFADAFCQNGGTAVRISTPANGKHVYNICTMLDQRRRRWTNVVQM